MLNDNLTFSFGSFPWKVARGVGCMEPVSCSFYDSDWRINDVWLPWSKIPTDFSRIPLASIIKGTMSRSVTVSSVTVWAPTAFFWISDFGEDDLLCFSLTCSWNDKENLGVPCSNGWWWALHSAILHFFLLKQSRNTCPLLKQRIQQLCFFMTFNLSSKEDDVKVGHDASRWSPLHKRQVNVLFWLVPLFWVLLLMLNRLVSWQCCLWMADT
jgi:hypothetical protein